MSTKLDQKNTIPFFALANVPRFQKTKIISKKHTHGKKESVDQKAKIIQLRFAKYVTDLSRTGS